MSRFPTIRSFQSLVAALGLLVASQVALLAQPIANSEQLVPADTAAVVGEPKTEPLNTDLLALMAGKCSTLNIAGRNYACRTVAYVHSVQGRVNFTIAVDDLADENHIISFSGENGERTAENLYDLKIDRMLLNSKSRPKVDGLPVAATVTSSGRCVQLGNFATGHVSSVVCSATDTNGMKYELRFESDGSPVLVRRVIQSAPTIRQNS
jgi:hypothetical protein